MVRKQVTISLNEDELKRAKAIAGQYGETFSSFSRRQIMMVVREEEEQNKNE